MDPPSQPTGSKGGNATSSDDGASSTQQSRETRSKAPLVNPTKPEVNNATEGRQHLTKVAMAPTGSDFTATSLVTTLLHIADVKGVTHATRLAIRSVAFVLEEVITETERNLLTEEMKGQI